MPVREAKLVIQIEDPSRDEARKMGVEDARGVSRDEMGVALEEVAAGKLPADRIALRALHAEMVTWPFLDSENKATGPKEVEAKPALSAHRAAAACARPHAHPRAPEHALRSLLLTCGGGRQCSAPGKLRHCAYDESAVFTEMLVMHAPHRANKCTL